MGALGPVFRTYDPSQDRLVAVKVFRLDITPEQGQALADELSKTAEAGLFHPSIVEPIAAGMEGTVAYRADEYVAAETLDVAMRHYAPAPIEKVLPFITQLAGAIDFARTAGIGHGALHPRDIFVTPEEARAGGFGTVEALERVGIRAPVRRPYTAPERVAGGRWDVTADVFSLGVITYELLTGRRPSGMGDRIGTITGGPQQAAIHTVLATAVAEDPSRRYPSALAFASSLDAAARGETAAGFHDAASGAGVVGATAAAQSSFDDDELLGTEMPPPAGVDEREEPVEAEREEDVFRASAPEFDDIAAERDEDQAHAALTLSELDRDPDRLAAAADRPLLDEAAEDLDFASEQEVATERFADEFGTVAAGESADEDHVDVRAPEPENRSAASLDTEWAEESTAAAPVAAYAASSSGLTDENEDEDVRGRYDEPVIVPDRRGFGLVPVTLVVALALLVGFAAGYAVRGRAPLAESAGAGSTQPGDAQTAGATSPQPYSEQAVTPSAADRPPSAEQQAPAGRAAAPAREPSATGSPAPSEGTTPPASPVATTGRVEVRSEPSNAGVTVNGEWRGRTPLTIDDLGFGSHVVRVVQPGFMTAREEVRLSASSPSRELSFRLQRAAPAETPAPARRPAPARQPERSPAARPPAGPTKYTGSIYVDSRPRGARVLVNGKFMGNTPLRIPDVAIGSQIVRLELPNYRFWTTTARVTAGQEARVTGSLEPIR